MKSIDAKEALYKTRESIKKKIQEHIDKQFELILSAIDNSLTQCELIKIKDPIKAMQVKDYFISKGYKVESLGVKHIISWEHNKEN